jgi:putative endonuclease
MARHIELGNEGEKLAVAHLRKLRYKILERNYRCKFGEIDIIALDKKALVFIEVKTRSSREFGSPQTGVTPKKKRQLTRVALAYLQKHQLFEREARFDVVAVEMDYGQERVDVIRNAFEISP